MNASFIYDSLGVINKLVIMQRNIIASIYFIGPLFFNFSFRYPPYNQQKISVLGHATKEMKCNILWSNTSIDSEVVDNFMISLVLDFVGFDIVLEFVIVNFLKAYPFF